MNLKTGIQRSDYHSHSFKFKDSKLANLITKNFSKNITENRVENILDLVIDSNETNDLKKEMRLMIEQENRSLKLMKLYNKAFALLLNSMMEDL